MTNPANSDQRRDFPVFLDPTGRRQRLVRRFGWVAGAVVAAYLALLATSLVTAPGLLPLSIPGVGRLLPDAGAPGLSDAGDRTRPHDTVARLLTTTPPQPSTAPTAPGAVSTGGGAGAAASATETATPTPTTSRTSARPTTTPTPTRRPTRTPTPAPTATTSPTRTSGTGKPTSRPSTAPSKTTGTGKPTAHPTPHHTSSP